MAYYKSAFFLCLSIFIGWYLMWPRGPQPTYVLNSTYDYIIVGGGSSGATLAARLSEDAGTSVLLLEAGDTPEGNILVKIPLMATQLWHGQYDWNYRTKPQKHAMFGIKNQSSAAIRGKVLGGSSSVNMLMAVRGSRHDYDSWQKEGCEGWSYSDVLPYFIKMEDDEIEEHRTSDYRGKGGPITVSSNPVTRLGEVVIQAGKELGYKELDCNGKEQIGFCRVESTVKNGIRASTYEAYLKPAMLRANLHVGVNSFVTKVNIVNKKAQSIDVMRENQKHTIKANKEIILSAGAFSSPQILMLSGIGPKEHLQTLGIPVLADLPVGENLQDHLVIPNLFFVNESLLSEFDVFNPFRIYNYLTTGKDLLASAFLETHAFLYTDGTNLEESRGADIQFVFQSINNLRGWGKHATKDILNITDESFEKMMEVDAEKPGILINPIMLHPKSKGHVRLRSTNPYNHPIIDPKYLDDVQDVEIFHKAIQKLLQIVDTDAMKKLGIDKNNMTPHKKLCEDHEYHSKSFWDCYIRYHSQTSWHPTTTCRMGSVTDSSAVVDPQLRVKGIQGLRVVDASVMRNVPSGNTNLPAIMIAEKAADMIRNKDTVKDIRKRLKNNNII